MYVKYGKNKNYHDTVISVELSFYIYIYTQIYSLTIGW